MRTILSVIVFAFCAVSSADAQKAPFSLWIVPVRSQRSGGTIEMAKSKAREFYVVLTNVSGEPRDVGETWNSWGYRTILFEITTASGKTFVVSKREYNFTVNFPATFYIAPGEHQIYAIQLGNSWETHFFASKDRGVSDTGSDRG